MRIFARGFAVLLACMMLAGACVPSLAEQGEDAEALPAAFDLRSVDTDGDGIGDRCYVPPVRLQNPFMTCWGFAATAASEISILGSILDHDPDAWKTINLSEKQLAYFAHVPLADEKNPQNGEGISTRGTDAVSVYNSGGNLFLAASAYAQGIGPASEDNAEYGDLFRYHGKEMNTVQRYFGGAYRNFSYSDMDDWSIPEEYRFVRDYYLTESVLLPSPAHNSTLSVYEYHPEANRLIKEQLLMKRGVSIGFMADTSRPDQDLSENGVYLNNRTWAHYTWEDTGANHGVTIIGWDDNYPKENFLPEHQPPEDGAWLVRNSWGSGEEAFPDSGEMNWGIPVQKKDADGNPLFDENGEPVMVGSGYFWLSYHDQSLTIPESFVYADSVAPEYIDQHDYLPVGDVICNEYDKPVKMANVFSGGHARILTEISCMTGSPDTEIRYEIHLLCDGFTSPEEGLCVSRGGARFAHGGYHRIQLYDPVYIQNGQAYAIVLEMTDPEGRYLTNEAVFYNIPGSATNPTAVINRNESFLFRNGAWADYQQIARENAENNTDVSAIPGAKAFYDNFAIKGYCNRIAGDMAMVPYVLAEKPLLTKELVRQFVQKGTMMINGNSYEQNLDTLGVSDPDRPAVIYIYPKNFEAKQKITELIEEYNKNAESGKEITYTDYVGLLMSSVVTITDIVSYVLIAFVSISLVVSSIMIGIITYISVLERTKEIGILRAIGASRRDVSRVFNAETLIVGFAAGVIGILMTLFLTLIANLILGNLTGIPNIASLPPVAGLILVAISMFLTLIAGLIPSGIASRKDPVVALRTE